MNKTINIPWLKIIGWAILIHIILIVISVLEVTIYAMIINPDQEQVVYEQHAQLTAPFITIILGIILFFFIARILVHKRYAKRKLIGIALPLTYIILDIFILVISGTDWAKLYLVFIISFLTKFLASYIGAISLKNDKISDVINNHN